MNKPILFSTLILISVFTFFYCSEDQKTITSNANNDGVVDITTMATPLGGKLKSAEEGPVRSALGEPTINLNIFRLEITGLVDSSYALKLEQIHALDAVYSDTILMYCVEGWEVWGNWKGILVEDLLDKAQVIPQGQYVLFSCSDGYTTALPISYLKKYKAMLAYQVNAKPLQSHDGFPLRLIAFGKFGYKWAKWVNKLEVISQSQQGYWENYGYSDIADVPLQRRRYYEGENAEPLNY